MKRFFLTTLLLIPLMAGAYTINVPAVGGDATKTLQAAIEEAGMHADEPVTIRLERNIYNISRLEGSAATYHISNTASEKEYPDPTKHIGLWFKDMANVTLDGNGATFVTHGEMTTFVIDNCTNIRLTDFHLTAADPSVAEFTIIAVDSASFVARISEPGRFEIDGKRLRFVGDGWSLPDDGSHPGAACIAQVFYPDLNVTKRAPNPLWNYREAIPMGEREVEFRCDRRPDVRPGEVYQVRHAVRNEAGGLITNSGDVTLDHINFNFLGNFGIVSQLSENISVESVMFGPDVNSERTCAGFADFLQFSSCKGLIKIADCSFEGSHDDPINIHGTHLQVQSIGGRKAMVKYMHPQTFGFAPFAPGDSVEFVNKNTLRALFAAKVESMVPLSLYEYELVLDKIIGQEYDSENLVVENITYTPEVLIHGNRFARTPTRGILLTTRRRSVISNNLFFRIPMAAILVSDDARNWYESGPVHDLTIKENAFVECSSPAILIKPENQQDAGAVHKNIVIENNTFVNQPEPAIEFSGADPVIIRDNHFDNRKNP